MAERTGVSRCARLESGRANAKISAPEMLLKYLLSDTGFF
jgi:hypothetical protein